MLLCAVALQADITQSLPLFGFVKFMCVWDLAWVKASTYTGQTQIRRKFRHTFTPGVGLEPVIPMS